MTTAVIKYNGHGDGDWCSITVERVDGSDELVYEGHGLISPYLLADILRSFGIIVDYNDSYEF
jgi:hypothetical protein